MLKFLSHKIKVTPPANTGKVIINSIAVIRAAQINSDHDKKLKNFIRQQNNVTSKLIEFKILDTPSRCTANITKSQAKLE
ncbi:hypothetical protein GCM10010106_51340 [Thermopolyspora flexuosa]|nr:hypothetical protein GCM10010106_51340 [Thermopolyspora flexuosa]